jgi:formylglycine-generating enzyme required for sulfatase activity
VSLDQGKTWSDGLSQCTGAVGKNISSGRHSITWNVLAERTELWGDGIRFRVKASSKKSYEPEMVFVEGGTFLMGSSIGDADEQPIHKVTLSSFSIGKYEVTQAQWQAVMGNNPSYNKGCDNCPVEQVSWNDIQGYIQKLNAQTGKQYRLPTEAEWEYAARGGKKSRDYNYSGSDYMRNVAWSNGNSGSSSHSVGGKQPNELGIYDMSGNVWEWCSDWYGPYRTDVVGSQNPKGPDRGEYRSLRGGSWFRTPWHCRSVNRDWELPDFKDDRDGFRLVLSPSSP